MTTTSLPSAEQDISRGAGRGAPPLPDGLSRFDAALLGGLAILSMALLFWATRDAVLAAGFLAGLAIAGGGVVLLRRLFPAVATGEAARLDDAARRGRP